MLEIFGWNHLNTNEIIQEKKLNGVEKARLQEIQSIHSKPDYRLMKGNTPVAFLDAKDLNVDITKVDKSANKVAFQIRSYGWSAQVPCSFVSNFEQLGIYQCTFKPHVSQLSNYGTTFLHVDDYIENFDMLYDYLYKENVYNGKLEEIYEVSKVEASQTLDADFMRILSEFRLKLGTNILANNTSLNVEGFDKLNYLVQLIMDRIIFIRVCEAKEIEKENLLQDYMKQDFWSLFKDSCYVDFYEHYDGALFDRDSEFNNLIVDNEVLEEFVNHLYWPSPYKFDIIPVSLIAEIYEYFLAKKIEVVHGKVVEGWKGIYQKSQGVVSTPKYLVDFICSNTIDLNQFNSIEEVLKVSIFEPACGSGTFLLSAFDLLEKRVIELFREKKATEEYSSWFVEDKEVVYLTLEAKREIMKNCLYGMDIDETAIEVTKMSLALKIVDDTFPLMLDKVGAYGEKILQDIHMNILNGNTLVELDFLELEVPEKEMFEANPIDLKLEFEKVINNGGFDYVIGNPPYVEAKHYTNLYPHMFEYIKDKYNVLKGKGDISLYFIKRALDLVKEDGKVGFITQKRFFKTKYGENFRKYISENQLLEQVVDFKSNSLFKNKNTYVAYFLLSKKENIFTDYSLILPEEPVEVRNIVSNNFIEIEHSDVKRIAVSSNTLAEKTWSYGTFNAESLLHSMEERSIFPLKSVDVLRISTGVQVLWNKLYRIQGSKNSNGLVTGTNRFKEAVEIEEGITKKLVANESFYPFKRITTDNYIIFPYKGPNNDELIPLSEIETTYPKAYKYLIENERRIKNGVKFLAGDKWHGYTRKHNHQNLKEKKILVPMTTQIPMATFVEEGQAIVPDNANMYQILFENSAEIPDELVKAVTCLINSKVFSYFARIFANPQLGDNFKFSKQFLEPIPFPYQNLIADHSVITELSEIHDSIQKSQETIHPSRERVQKAILTHKWNRLNEIVNSLYQLTNEEVLLIQLDRLDV